jgi:hypothetical protein
MTLSATSPNGKDSAQQTQLAVYQAEDGTLCIDARLEGETVWLSLNQLAELFQVDKSGISRHLKNIFESKELVRDSVVAKFATTAVDGKTYQVEHFNLDAIISVGYRVKSRVATHFRQWATSILREHMVKGYTVDRKRLAENADELAKALELVRRSAGSIRHLDEGRGLVDVISRYTRTSLWLQQYDTTSTVGYVLALSLDIPPDLPLRYAEVSGRNGDYSKLSSLILALSYPFSKFFLTA